MPTKPSTEKLYEKIINILKNASIDLYKMKKPDDIINKLIKIKTAQGVILSESSQKTYLSAIIWFYKTKVPDDEFVTKLSKKLQSYSKEPNKEVAQNKLTEKQKETYAEWEDILSIKDTLETNSESSQLNHIKYLVYCLYTMQPPRRLEYHKIKIVNKASEITDKTINYFVNVKQSYFLFFDHKNANRNDKKNIQKIMISAPLHKIIGEYIEKYNITEYLLKLTKEALRGKIRTIFKDNLKKDVSIDILRHSYKTFIDLTTDTKTMTTRKKEILAHKMGHSVHMNDKYSKKNE
jgi:hypothetical protein